MIYCAPESPRFRQRRSVFQPVRVETRSEICWSRMGICTVSRPNRNDLCTENFNASHYRILPFYPLKALFSFRQAIQVLVAALFLGNAPAGQDSGNPDSTR